MRSIIELFESLIEPSVVLLVLVILLILNTWIFNRIKSSTSHSAITKGVISFFLVLMGLLVFILALPIDKSLKGQILGFLGIIISAGIALSSTTVLGNLIAGIMSNSMNRFRNGDLIKIGDFHGRVIRKSIFHTEIQLEDSNFITIPNLFIASHPVKLIRKSNTVISTSVSLGYDIPHGKIEKALKNAAMEAGLSDPYVYIISLGDFSVVYKIHGFLEDTGKYFSTSSQLNAQVIDKLHEEKIEIVSPTFMNQRRVDEMDFIPEQVIAKSEAVEEKSPEELIFDEAIKSEKMEKKKDSLKEIDKRQEVLREKLKELRVQKDEVEIKKIQSYLKRNEELKERIEKSIKEQLEREEDSAR